MVDVDMDELRKIVQLLRGLGGVTLEIVAGRIEAAITPKPALTLPLTVGQRVMFGSNPARIIATDFRGKSPVVFAFESGTKEYLTFADQNGAVVNHQGQLSDADE